MTQGRQPRFHTVSTSSGRAENEGRPCFRMGYAYFSQGIAFCSHAGAGVGPVVVRQSEVDRFGFDAIGTPYPDVIEGLQRIRALGYPIMAPLTNGDREMVRIGIIEPFTKLGFTFDNYFTADMWGKNKVHPDIYLRSIDKLGLEPSEVVFVCRGQFDIVGGKAAGLKVIWVNRAGEPLEDHGYVPDWEVKDFLEVAELLKRERP